LGDEMGRLSGFRYRDIVKKLKAFGFEFYRNAVGSHEIWRNKVQGVLQLFPITLVTCPKALCARS